MNRKEKGYILKLRKRARQGFMLTEVLLSIMIIALTVGGIFSVIGVTLTNMRYTSEMNELRGYASMVTDAIVATNNSGGRSMINIISDLYGKSKLPYTVNWDELCNSMADNIQHEGTNTKVSDIADWTMIIPEEVRVKYKTEITFIPSTRVLTTSNLKGRERKAVNNTNMTTIRVTITKLVDDYDSVFLQMLGTRRTGTLTYYLTLRAKDGVIGQSFSWASEVIGS